MATSETGLRTLKSMDGGYQLPFSSDEYQQRIDRMRGLMTQAEIDTLYVTSPEGMCYFTGYQATWYRAQSSTRWPALAAVAIQVDHSEPIYYDTMGEILVHEATSNARNRQWIRDELMEGDPDGGIAHIVKDLQQRGWAKGRVGMEMWSHLPNPILSRKLQAQFEQAGAEVVDATASIRGVRKVKSSQELRYIEEAAQIADIGHKAIADGLRPGVTQLELHGIALHAMLAAGGELPGINRGVMSGPLASAHALSSRRPIQPGESFVVDLCGVVNRYHANICRSFVYGEPSAETLRMSQASKGGVELLCQVARDGASVAQVAKTLREYFIGAAVWDQRAWVGGYELGIAFPPDWVGEWLFNVDAEAEPGVFEVDMVTNFESVFVGSDPFSAALGVNIDTIIYGQDRSRALSQIDLMPIVVG